MDKIYQQILEKLNKVAQLLKEWLKTITNPLPPETPQTDPILPIKTIYLWNDATNSRHSVRVICDEEGLTVQQKNELCATVACETGGTFDPNTIHKNSNGSTDFGISQINDFFWIGTGKTFPSGQWVQEHPEECIRWMAGKWKTNQMNLWNCYKSENFKSYL